MTGPLAKLIHAEPAGPGVEFVWYDGRKLPGMRPTEGVSRKAWVAAMLDARRRHEAGEEPDPERYIPYA